MKTRVKVWQFHPRQRPTPQVLERRLLAARSRLAEEERRGEALAQHGDRVRVEVQHAQSTVSLPAVRSHRKSSAMPRHRWQLPWL
jgi:hypothetical protein